MTKIGFIGTGNMATALIRSIKTSTNYEIISSDKNKEKLAKAQKELETMAASRSARSSFSHSDMSAWAKGAPGARKSE